jgi:hypothetical protein
MQLPWVCVAPSGLHVTNDPDLMPMPLLMHHRSSTLAGSTALLWDMYLRSAPSAAGQQCHPTTRLAAPQRALVASHHLAASQHWIKQQKMQQQSPCKVAAPLPRGKGVARYHQVMLQECSSRQNRSK